MISFTSEQNYYIYPGSDDAPLQTNIEELFEHRQRAVSKERSFYVLCCRKLRDECNLTGSLH
jgi:hypothetical protein